MLRCKYCCLKKELNRLTKSLHYKIIISSISAVNICERIRNFTKSLKLSSSTLLKRGRICRDRLVETISQFKHLAFIFLCHFLSQRCSSGRMHGSNIFQRIGSSNCEFAPRGKKIAPSTPSLFALKIPLNCIKFGVCIDYIALLEATVTLAKYAVILSGRAFSPLYWAKHIELNEFGFSPNEWKWFHTNHNDDHTKKKCGPNK